MQFPIVQQYQTDITGINPENQILDEPKHVEAGAWTRIIIPLHAPFFVNSLTVTRPDGSPLIVNTDYRIFRLMSRLTELCAQPVSCMIELLDPTITDVLMDYHVVGEFSLIDNDLLQLVTDVVADDRPVLWANLTSKPVVFPPTLHSHSLLTDIVAWQDTIECMDLYLAMQVANGRDPFQVRLDYYDALITNYVNVYSDMLMTFLDNHMGSHNAHGLTASQIGKGLVDNFATATSSNVLQGRSNLHLTPTSLETIIDTYVSSKGDYLAAASLPISSFVNPGFKLTASGWNLVAASPVNVVFQGKAYTIPAGTISLGSGPANSTFYIYVTLTGSTPQYVITTQKTLETVSKIWVATIITGATQIATITCFTNLFLLNGYRISEVKMGNSIPASSGSINSKGSCPWLDHSGPTPPTIITVSPTVLSNSSGNILTVSGATAADGAAITYTLTQTTGPTVTFSKTSGVAAGEQVTFTAPTLLVSTPITISIIAIDSFGEFSTAKTTTVTILAHVGPTAPTVLTVPATVKQSSTGNVVTISGSTANDGATITYSLSQSGSSAVVFSKTNGIAAGEQVTFTAPGVSANTVISIIATAMDSMGLSSPTKSTSVTVLAHVGPTVPTLTVPTTVKTGSTGNVLTVGGSTASDGAMISYTLTQTSGPAVTFSRTTSILAGQQITFTAPTVSANTPITISAVAVDSMGGTSAKTNAVSTILIHVAPTAPTSLRVPGSVYMNSTGNVITVSGSTANDGATLTYSLSQSGSVPLVFSKTSGIADGEVVTYSTPTVSVNTTVSILAFAVDSMGAVSPQVASNTTVLSHVPPTAPVALTWYETVSGGDYIAITGSTTNDGATLTYSLSQIAGPTVMFAKINGITEGEMVTVVVPNGTIGQVVTFSAYAIDSFGSIGPSTSVSITLYANPTLNEQGHG